MSGKFVEVNGIRIYEVPEDGPALRTGSDAVDLMSAASEFRADFIAIPVSRLDDDFFELRTRIAGELAQKFVMYGRRIAIVGDIAQRTAASRSLAAFVAESNRGRDLWFVENMQELGKRLADG
jgi:hypothetical protein